MKTLRKIVMVVFGGLAVLGLQVLPAAAGGGRGSVPDNGPRSLAPYFTPATATPKAPDNDGFLQRWLLLEPEQQCRVYGWLRPDHALYRVFSRAIHRSSARRRQGDGIRRSTRLARAGLFPVQREALSLRVWPEQAGLR